ncbi:MAG: sigma-70 family RNA polymerase sigma factor [Ruminococcaceae bacterium]|nr:sigma-70 family RNA polymerase sigma factor [Oscillospiraceae bacterium]
MWMTLLSSLSNLLFWALHIVNPGTFPRPLSAADEREALVAWREHGDRAARTKLIEHNLRLVAHIIKKYYSNTDEADDLISIGTIGLIKAVDTFDHTKNVRLVTYASRCVENEILMHFRAKRRRAADVSFSDPIETDRDGNELTLMDVVAGEDTLAEELETKINGEKIHRYLYEELDEREREIIVMRYGLAADPLPQREVAKKLNISRSYVSRIEKRALEKLHTRFERGDGA